MRKLTVKRNIFLLIGIVITLVFGITCTARAAGKNAKRDGWVKKEGYYYYYKNKKALKGFKQIEDKYYLFDNNGRQQTGWRKVGKDVRYFQIKNGKKGYMLTKKTVNHIKLNKKGVAKVTADVSERIGILLRYQKLVDYLQIKPASSQKSKLVRVFKYSMTRRYKDMESVYRGAWDLYYARVFLDAGYADCVGVAVGFAYLANAIGYKNILVRNAIHGHCEIDGLIYDPGYAQSTRANYLNFFGKTYEELPTWHHESTVPCRKL